MLTKVHALASSDGLPIYDSRVAVAIASLVELWRTARRTNGQPLPETLTFPAAYNSRTVRNDAFPAAVSPGVIGGANATVSWASAKVRLGWLMEKFLRETRRGLLIQLSLVAIPRQARCECTLLRLRFS